MTGPDSPVADYRGHFQRPDAVAAYLSIYAGQANADEQAWAWQRRHLLATVHRAFGTDLHGRRVLDYACGAGRVLAELAARGADAHGWDSSAVMLTECRRAVPAAQLRQVDLSAPGTADHRPEAGRFDVITAFRLLLNLEPDRRAVVLRGLAGRLTAGGLLIVDNHGNRRSLRHLALRGRRRRPAGFANELSDSTLRDLFAMAGLRVLDRAGFGWLPGVLHRSRVVGPLARRVDGFLLARTRTPVLAIRVVYVAARDPSPPGRAAARRPVPDRRR